MRAGEPLFASSSPSELKAARLSVSLVFLIHGILVSNWLSRIPAVQYNLKIEVGVLGLVLLGAPVGSVLAMPITSKLIGRFGSATITRISTLLLCAVLPLPALAGGPVSLATALLVYGAFVGAMDVAMNTQAVDMEREYQRPVMVSFHALFSIGGMVGAMMGSFAAGHSVSPAPHLIAAAASMALLGIFGMRRLLPDQVKPSTFDRSARALWLPMLPLGIMAACILMGEGAMGDWSAVYLNRLAGPTLAPMGYAVFSFTMAFGRLAGDWLHHHLGSVVTLRLGSALAASGLAVALALGGLAPAFAGFACVGFGLSAIFPIICSVAGKRAGPQPEAGIAAVTTTGYLGLLAGPPLIGYLAHISSLRLALGFVALLSGIASLLAPVARIQAAHTVGRPEIPSACNRQ